MALAALALAGCGSGTKTVTVVTQAPTSSTHAATTITQASTTTQATTTSAPQPSRTVVLGSASFAPNGNGFGTAQPSEIFNGGDPSGNVSQIQWTGWGSSIAHGIGMSSIFMPQGGYYPQLVTIQLRAEDLGSCTPGGPSAYRKLSVREPSAPGGPLGPWMSWSGANTICTAP